MIRGIGGQPLKSSGGSRIIGGGFPAESMSRRSPVGRSGITFARSADQMPDPRCSFPIFPDDATRMKRTADLLDGWLSKGSRAELAGAILRSHAEVGLPQARKIIDRLNALEPAAHRLRLGVIHTYTSDLLDPWLSFEFALQGLHCEALPRTVRIHSAGSASGLRARPASAGHHSIDAAAARPASGPWQSPSPAWMRASGTTCARPRSIASATWPRNSARRWMGWSWLRCCPPCSGRGWVSSTATPSVRKRRGGQRSKAVWCSACARTCALRCFWISTKRWCNSAGSGSSICVSGIQRAFRSRPSPPARWRAESRRLERVSKQPKAKVIVLDADNTLWGGVIGEDGIDGIALGPDYPGNAYVAFQRRLLDYQQRGFILALCSKNNPADLDEVLREHPHQLLRDAAFRRAPRQLGAEAGESARPGRGTEPRSELFIFVDDSDHECARGAPRAAAGRSRADAGQPDRHSTLPGPGRAPRGALPHRRRPRQDRALRPGTPAARSGARVSHGGGDLDDYLRSLEMKMRIGIDDASQLARLAQLTQKTNQFNLTTRRYNEQQMQGLHRLAGLAGRAFLAGRHLRR